MEAGMAQPPERPPTARARVRELGLEILSHHTEGLPDGELVMQVLAADASLDPATVSDYVADGEQTFPGMVYRPARGVFRLTVFREPDVEVPPLESEPGESIGFAPQM